MATMLRHMANASIPFVSCPPRRWICSMGQFWAMAPGGKLQLSSLLGGGVHVCWLGGLDTATSMLSNLQRAWQGLALPRQSSVCQAYTALQNL